MSAQRRKWAIDADQESKQPQNVLKQVAARAPDNTDLKIKKAWEQATAPGKGIFMQAFMLWMAGSGVNIFSIMITVYAIINPAKAIMSTNSAFARFSDVKKGMFEVKAVFILLNLLSMAVAIYKCATLGFLPTTPSDWVSMLPVKEAMEFSSGGLASF